MGNHLAVVRGKHGHIQSGVVNPWGPAGNPRVQVQRRIDCRLAERLSEEGETCIEEMVDEIILCLATPSRDPIVFRLATERLWPAIQLHEHRTADLEPEGSGEDIWLRLAEDVDRLRAKSEATTVEPLEDGSGEAQ